MKKLFLLSIIAAIISACQSDNKSGKTLPDGIHSAIVEEVLQSSQYTYLHVKENNNESWLAIPAKQVNTGETYYYKDGLLMNDFESKELNRKFEEILFLDNISTSPDDIAVKNNVNTGTTPSGNNAAVSDTENKNSNAPSGTHTVIAEEVLQTSKYTYIRAKENENEFWLAVSKMDASTGTSYTFKGGLLMTDFVSKELKRTFKEVLFVDNIQSNSSELEKNISESQHTKEMASKGSAIDLEKKDIKMSHSNGDITIAKLYENKNSYSGKTIKLRGQVTKVNQGIMQKNWLHLQDGTEFSGKFDLTVTTSVDVEVGDDVTVEGTISLDKDFGFGYFYDVIMEDAKIIK